MAVSGKTMNVKNVAFSPSGGGSAVPITGVTSVSVSGGGSLQKFAGDGDHYNTTVVNDFADPSFTLNFATRPSALNIFQGERGTLTWTALEARNVTGGVATGNTVFTVTTAIIQSIDFADSFRQFGTNTVTISTESSDGITSPISFSVAS